MLKERGLFKQRIKNIFFSSNDVMRILVDDYEKLTDKQKKEAFSDSVKSHLFIDNTLTEKGTYIFFDVVIPNFRTQTKECKIVMYLICHRDLLDGFNFKDYSGNRTDILAQVVEECLLNPKNKKQFGIGNLLLSAVDIYNSNNYYGIQMIFDAECFR